MNLLLIGLRGCGKTTVGRLLAARTKRPFVDLDDDVLSALGHATVHAAWADGGETAWREAEVRCLGERLSGPGPPPSPRGEPVSGAVISLGGGAPTAPGARAMLDTARRDGRALVVLLDCSTAELARRLRAAPGDRPSLTGQGLVEEIETVRRARQDLYEAIADVTLDTTKDDPERVVEGILDVIAAG